MLDSGEAGSGEGNGRWDGGGGERAKERGREGMEGVEEGGEREEGLGVREGELVRERDGWSEVGVEGGVVGWGWGVGWRVWVEGMGWRGLVGGSGGRRREG